MVENQRAKWFFHFSYPLAMPPEREAPTAAPATTPGPPRPRRMVLLVEDTATDALMLRAMLAKVPGQPFGVEWVETLGAGLQRLAAGGIHLLLLDLSLPDSQGLDTVDRACAAAPQLPIVVLTGSDDEALSNEAVRRGAQDFLFKPKADPYWLERALRYAIERKSSEVKLRAFATKLEQSNRDLQEFAFIASHDLQAPLEKVLIFGQRLEEECGAVINDKGRDFLQRLCNATRRMQQLVQGLLTYSRVNTQAQPFAQVDLTAIARDVVGDLEARLEQGGGHVEVGPLGMLEGDPTQLRQLLQNLIGNALKFHRPGVAPVVKVRSRLLEGSSPGAASGGGPRCEIIVEDNGTGFDEKYLGRLFVMFQRLHRPEQYEGTGIGLAVCRRIVERHGGSIVAHSQPGQGASFTVTLPLRQKRTETLL